MNKILEISNLINDIYNHKISRKEANKKLIIMLCNDNKKISFTADDIKEVYELGRAHEKNNSDCTSDMIKTAWIKACKWAKLKWE